MNADEAHQQELEHQEWVCTYCGRSAKNADHPNVFACCGEVGHVELAPTEEA